MDCGTHKNGDTFLGKQRGAISWFGNSSNELATVYWVPCVTHNAVEAVEGGVEVGLLPQAVHLDEHLGQEDSQENEFCKIYKGQKI